MDKQIVKQFYDRAEKVLAECKAIAVELARALRSGIDPNTGGDLHGRATAFFCTTPKSEMDVPVRISGAG
jgi:hypothetical protein